MELQKVVVLCTIVAVIGIIAWFFLTKQGERSEDASGRASETTPQAPDETRMIDDGTFVGTGSMFDILSLGRSVACTYTFNDESGEGSGTGYFDGQRMRVDSNYTQDGKTFETHMINDGTNLYSWTVSSEGTFAFVTQNQETDDAESDQSMPMQQGQNDSVDSLNESVEYDCRAWRAEEGAFTPPRDIEFVDMSAMFEGMMQGMMPEAE